MIDAIRIEMLPGHSTGNALFLTGAATAHQGTADTDLDPGIYGLAAQKGVERAVVS